MSQILFKVNTHLAQATNQTPTGLVLDIIEMVQKFLPGNHSVVSITQPNNAQHQEIVMDSDFYKQDVELEFTFTQIVISDEDLYRLSPNLERKVFISNVRTINHITGGINAQQMPQVGSPQLVKFDPNSINFIPINITIGADFACEHEKVDVGFNRHNWVCKHCNKDMN